MRSFVVVILAALALPAAAHDGNLNLAGGQAIRRADSAGYERLPIVITKEGPKIPNRSLSTREQAFIESVPESISGTPRFRQAVREMLLAYVVHVPE